MVSRRPGRLLPMTWTTKRAPHAQRLRTNFPAAMEATRLYARHSGGIAGNGLAALLGAPVTAHPIGGAPIGADASQGVIDGISGEVFGYRNLRVVDGTVIPSNLGVNPALTITALSEYLMANVPVFDAERAARICPVRFSPPAYRSVSELMGEGDLYAETLRRARGASVASPGDGGGASPTA
jgi:cholesterol oxidase